MAFEHRKGGVGLLESTSEHQASRPGADYCYIENWFAHKLSRPIVKNVSVAHSRESTHELLCGPYRLCEALRPVGTGPT